MLLLASIACFDAWWTTPRVKPKRGAFVFHGKMTPPISRPSVQLLTKMRGFLKSKNYTQVPQLSSGQVMDTNQPWMLRSNKGRTKALFIGINYSNSPSPLSGCHNDVVAIKQHVTEVWGFDRNSMRVLMDNGRDTRPTKANIISAMRWLVEDARPGEWPRRLCKLYMQASHTCTHA